MVINTKLTISNGNEPTSELWIKGDNDALDYSSNAYSTTPSNVTFDTGKQFTNAMVFNGTDSVVTINDQPAIPEFSVADQETGPIDIFFKDDGTKMYILGTNTGDKVYEYDLGTAWDEQSAVYNGVSLNVTTIDTSPTGLFIKPDGTKLYVLGDAGNDLNEYTMSTPWDLSTATYTTVSAAFTEDTGIQGLTFKPDGTKLYIIGVTSDYIYQYSLSVAWDLSTISFDNVQFALGVYESQAGGLQFNNDGTKLFTAGTTDTILEIKLTTAYNLSTAWTIGKRKYIGLQDTSAQGIYIKSDGLVAWVIGSGFDKVYRYDLPSAWELYDNSHGTAPTEIYAKNKYLNVVGGCLATEPNSVKFSSDGTKMFVASSTPTASIYLYNLSTAWDVTTGTYSGTSYNITQDIGPSAIYFKPDGTKLYIVGRSNDRIYQYSLGTAWDITTITYDTKLFAQSDSEAWGLKITDDGTKWYLAGNATNVILQYTMSTPWDISSSVFVQSINTNTLFGEGTPVGIELNSDGTILYLLGQGRDLVIRLLLNTPYDISTVVEDKSMYLSVVQDSVGVIGITFKPDGTKLYVVENSLDAIWQYDLTTPWEFDMSSGFSLEAWIYPNSIGETNGTIMAKGVNNTGFAGYVWQLGANTLFFRMDSGQFPTSAANSITYGVWNQVITTITGSGVVTHYINGVKSGFSAGTQAVHFIIPTNDTAIGNQANGTDRTFDGRIGDVRRINQVLTDTKVEALYNAGTGITTEDLSTIYKPDSMKIKKSIGENNTTGTFELNFRNENGFLSNNFSVGEDVIFYIDEDTYPATTKRFTGLIEDITFKGQGSNKEELIIKGRDYTARLQDMTVTPIVYNDTEISLIVLNIIANNIVGITTTNVMTTTKILTHISFSHTPVFDALKELARLVDYIFYVDENKDLHFEPKGATVSPYLLNNTNIFNSQFRTLDRELANKVWIYGNRVLTNWEQSFTANGGSVYNLSYKAHNTRIFVGGSIVPKFGGVYNFSVGDVGSPTQYLVDYDGQNIIFVSGTGWNNIPISGTDAIKINYDRSVPIIQYGQDDTSIAAYKEREKVIIDKNIKDPRQATDRLYVELRDNSSPIIEGQATVYNLIDINPGQKITVDLPWSNINNQIYDILEVNYDLNPNTIKKGNVVTLRLNKRILDIVDSIKQLALDVRKLQAEETFDAESFTRAQFSTGSVGFNVFSWYVKTRNYGNEFRLGHALNGKLGSPAIGFGGSQVTLGSGALPAYIIRASGGTFS